MIKKSRIKDPTCSGRTLGSGYQRLFFVKHGKDLENCEEKESLRFYKTTKYCVAKEEKKNHNNPFILCYLYTTLQPTQSLTL